MPEPRYWLPGWLRSATRLGELELAERILDATNPHSPLDLFNSQAARAVLTEVRLGPDPALEKYSAVTEAARRFGAVIEEAFALLGQGRCLIALNRPDEAILVLQHARDMFTNMGARPALAETEARLASVNHAAEGKER